VRDIVRCWTDDGAICDLPASPAAATNSCAGLSMMLSAVANDQGERVVSSLAMLLEDAVGQRLRGAAAGERG
jgi:hypothetical protein